MTDSPTANGLLARIGKWFRPDPPVHDVWLDGIGAFVFRVEGGGKRVTISGWRDDHRKFETGHLVRFLKKEGNDVLPSTYRITRVKHCWDPNDMYFLDCEYVGARQ